MQLIDEWRRAHRMLSMQAMTAATALLGAWQALPDTMQALIPERYVLWVAVALLVLGMVGRLVKQPSVSDVPATDGATP
jgi:type VI protein secretion system component VasF